jgi:hypothetical protein
MKKAMTVVIIAVAVGAGLLVDAAGGLLARTVGD